MPTPGSSTRCFAEGSNMSQRDDSFATGFSDNKGRKTVDQLLELQAVQSVSTNTTPTIIQQVIDRYQHLFLKLHGLPPQRETDHAIPLLPGWSSTNSGYKPFW